MSPTILKGVNEDAIIQVLEYARNRPLIKEVALQGFFWSGDGVRLSRARMIMQDETMDVVFRRYFTGDRESVYTFQKAIHALARLLGIQMCSYVQAMIFARGRNGLTPITDFLAMDRLKKGMTWWERFAGSGRFVQRAALAWVLFRAVKPRTRGNVLNIDRYHT